MTIHFPTRSTSTFSLPLRPREGVCWDPVRNCLWAGGEAGQVYRVELDGSVNVVTTIGGGALLGLALDANETLYICDPGNHQVWTMDAHFEVAAFGDAIDYPNYPRSRPTVASRL